MAKVQFDKYNPLGKHLLRNKSLDMRAQMQYPANDFVKLFFRQQNSLIPDELLHMSYKTISEDRHAKLLVISRWVGCEIHAQ